VDPTELVSIPNDGNLDAFNPEPGEPAATPPLMVVVNAGAPPQPAARPAPFSRVEAAQARHACDSFAHLVGRAARGASRSTRRAGLAMAHLSNVGLRTIARALATTCRHTALVLRHALAAAISGGALASRHTITAIRHGGAIARHNATLLHRSWASAIQGMADAARTRRRAWRAQRAEESALRHLESEGSLVAVGLAVVVIGYGVLFVISWRHPATMESTSGMAAARPVVVDTTNAGATHATVAVVPMPPGPAVDVRPRIRVMSASTLNTIWRRNDTRSLQQAFASLRSETLAFHRCSVKMTAVDRAVAQCDGVAGFVGADSEGAAPRTTWTLDFRRTGGRWAIQRVRTR
jgi:hypothetical protein